MECSPMQAVCAINEALPPGGRREELVGRCAEGDEEAWNRLYSTHVRTTRAFLFRLGVREDNLDDACQEVFLQAFRYLGEFRGEASFSTWLYRLCATQARRVRQRVRLADALSRLLFWEAQSGTDHTNPPNDDADALFEAGVRALTQSERETFVLYEIEGLSGKRIAEVLDCPEPTVWRRLHYARKKFCAVVEKQRKATR
jgi:RNA polymerase sigma-70 factor, ECF subfamily